MSKRLGHSTEYHADAAHRALLKAEKAMMYGKHATTCDRAIFQAAKVHELLGHAKAGINSSMDSVRSKTLQRHYKLVKRDAAKMRVWAAKRCWRKA